MTCSQLSESSRSARLAFRNFNERFAGVIRSALRRRRMPVPPCRHTSDGSATAASGHEPDSVSPALVKRAADLDRDTCLADSTGAGDRNEAVLAEEPADIFESSSRPINRFTGAGRLLGFARSVCFSGGSPARIRRTTLTSSSRCGSIGGIRASSHWTDPIRYSRSPSGSTSSIRSGTDWYVSC